jgi:3-oxoacyl-[acyl-carrier protein] reductase
MDLRLSGLRAIVTGGTKGIGRAIAQTLASEGVDIALCARNLRDVEKTVADFAHYGVKVFGRDVDVGHAKDLAAWVHDAGSALGGIDIVIANVSALAIANDEAGWRTSFDVDMMGTVRLVNAAMPYLERSSRGAIVTISSVSGREIDFAAGPYGALKAAIVHYTQGLAQSLAAKHIRANSVSPGNTYFADGVWNQIENSNPAFFKEALAMNPMGRMGTPQEIANAVVFLASPAASFITGSNLVVDGGLTKGLDL